MSSAGEEKAATPIAAADAGPKSVKAGATAAAAGPAAAADAKSTHSGSCKSSTGGATSSSEIRAPDTELLAKFYARSSSDQRACLLRDVCLSAAGELFVTDGGNRKIKVYDLQGQLLREISHPDLKEPFGIALISDAKFAVTDARSKDVKIFTVGGELVATVGKNLDEYPMKDPRGIAVNSKGDIIVSDACRRCIYVYPLEGAFCDIIWGQAGVRPLQFKNPLYVTTMSNDDIVVSDYFNGRVAVFDSHTHDLVFTYGTKKDQKKLRYPRGVCVGRHGDVIVADNYNGKVQMIGEDGSFKRYIAGDLHGLKRPRAVATDGSGHLAVVENGGRVKIYHSLLV